MVVIMRTIVIHKLCLQVAVTEELEQRKLTNNYDLCIGNSIINVYQRCLCCSARKCWINQSTNVLFKAKDEKLKHTVSKNDSWTFYLKFVNLNFLLSFIVLEGFLPAVPVRNTRRNNASTRRNAIFLANFYSFVSFCVSVSTGDFDAQKKDLKMH